MKNPKPDPVQQFLNDRKKPVRRLIGASVLFSCINAGLMITGAWLLAEIIAGALFEHIDTATLLPLIITLIGIYATRALCAYASERAAFKAANTVKDNVRRDIAIQLITLHHQNRISTQSGTFMSAYIEGVEALHNYYMQSLPSRMTATIIPLAIFFCIVPHDGISALILLVTAPLIPVFMIWIGRGAERLSQRQWRRMTYMGGRFFDLVQGLPTLKMLGAAQREGRTIGKLGEAFRQDTMAVLRIAFLSSLAMEFFATVSIALIAVLIGFRLLWGEMAFVHGFFILLLAPEFYMPLRRMGATYHAKMEAIGAAEKITDILGAPTARAPEKPIVQKCTAVRIEFCNVTYGYDPSRPVLNNVNFVIEPGTHVALMGPSGHGKSTLIRLMLGLIEPQQGEILINGHPLHQTDIGTWRQHISWIGQNPHLFHGSVMENVKLSQNVKTDADILDILDQCGIGDLSARILGENGAGISGGQAQRVALARALAHPAPLFLLDEPAAYLDTDSAFLIRQAIHAATPGATVIFATHRTDLLSLVDMVLHVENAQVQEMKRRSA